MIIFFREVFRARHKKTKKIVALKKVLMENEKEGVSIHCPLFKYKSYVVTTYSYWLRICYASFKSIYLDN